MEFIAFAFVFFSLSCGIDSYRFIAMEQRRSESKCEKVIAQTCLTKVSTGYNSTMFPNHVGHTNQQDAIRELTDYEPLIEYGCSNYLSTFLCSVYVPICTPGLRKPVKPCRSLCEQAASGCASIMKNYGYEWKFNCTQFPDPKTGTELCLGVSSGKDKQVENKKNNVKKHKKKGRVSGEEGDQLEIKCSKNKFIFIRKVIHYNSTCCKEATKSVLTAMCNGKSKCRVNVSPSDLGGHCVKGKTGKLTVRYKCTTYKDVENCPN